MKDFVLGDDFLKTCVDLPEEIRETIVSQLRAYSRNPRSRDLVIEGIEGTRNVLSLPVDGTYRILLRREKPFTSLICVTGSSVPPNPAASKHRSSDETQFAPVDIDICGDRARWDVVHGWVMKYATSLSRADGADRSQIDRRP